MPDLSAIIPFERGHHLLVAALDGFLDQSIPIRQIEVVLVAPASVRAPVLARHRKLRIRKVEWPRRGDLAAAVNAGATAARGAIVAVVAPGWRPLPRLAEYCLRFHEQEPGAGDTVALPTCVDPVHADDPLLWWLQSQRLAGLDAPSPGIHSWRGMRFDAVSFKRELLRSHPIPHGEGDESLMRTLWANRVPLRVFAEPVPVLCTSGRANLGAVLAREYRAAFARFRAMASAPQTFAGDHVDDRFQHPERYLLSKADQAELVAAIAESQSQLAGHRAHFAVGGHAEQFALLGKLYLAAVSHARSAGWADAKHRRPRAAGEDRCLRLVPNSQFPIPNS